MFFSVREPPPIAATDDGDDAFIGTFSLSLVDIVAADTVGCSPVSLSRIMSASVRRAWV